MFNWFKKKEKETTETSPAVFKDIDVVKASLQNLKETANMFGSAFSAMDGAHFGTPDWVVSVQSDHMRISGNLQVSLEKVQKVNGIKLQQAAVYCKVQAATGKLTLTPEQAAAAEFFSTIQPKIQMVARHLADVKSLYGKAVVRADSEHRPRLPEDMHSLLYSHLQPLREIFMDVRKYFAAFSAVANQL